MSDYQKKVRFTVLGEPQGKGRPRFRNTGKFVSTYTPVETVNYENLIKVEYRRQCGKKSFDKDVPIDMRITAYYSIPKSVSEKKRQLKAKRIILMDDNEESRMLMENCQLKGTRTVNPIIDWDEVDIWDYCAAEGIKMNPLYACGWKRVGCIGCPMANKHRKIEFARYPKIKAAYIRAFDRMLDERKRKGLDVDWKTGEDVYHWWMEDGVLPGQMIIDGLEE